MAYLIMPHPERSADLGVDHLAHVPVIWTAKWELMEEASEYLIARSLGRWAPSIGQRTEYSIARKPSENSMLAYGRDLEHFLTYCERRRLDWRVLTYEHLLDTYQADMESGRVSKEKASLAPATINRRMSTVCDFVGFAAARGLREAFEMSYEPAPGRAKAESERRFERRVGRVRSDPQDLRLPSRAEIKAWLDGIKGGHPGVVGITAYLMCRMTIETNMRAEEVVLFRADQLPDPDDETKVRPGALAVMVEIMYGTKGGRKAGDAEKKGKKRKIRMARDWMGRLHAYKRITRKLALKKFRELHPGAPDPKELFLSPFTGEPYSYNRFREFWIQKDLRQKTLPFPGWTPHAGRHAWACYELLDRLEDELARLNIEAELARGVGHRPSVEWTKKVGNTVIDTYIRPLMGHISRETTELYLRWLASHVGADHYARNWSYWLDADEGAELDE